MQSIPRKAIRILLIGFTAFASMAVSSYGYFPTGDVFAERPPRVRVATPDELEASAPRWYNFALDTPLPPSDPQESITLTESDALLAVFPARNWAHSDRSIYQVASTVIEGYEISLDYYIFKHPESGATDSFSPPFEQFVPLGLLPAGSYSMIFRYWYLNYEDRLGFNESDVPRWSPPEDFGFYVIPDRHVTQEAIDFRVIPVAVPEPTSWVMCAVIFIVALRARCLTARGLIRPGRVGI